MGGGGCKGAIIRWALAGAFIKCRHHLYRPRSSASFRCPSSPGRGKPTSGTSSPVRGRSMSTASLPAASPISLQTPAAPSDRHHCRSTVCRQSLPLPHALAPSSPSSVALSSPHLSLLPTLTPSLRLSSLLPVFLSPPFLLSDPFSLLSSVLFFANSMINDTTAFSSLGLRWIRMWTVLSVYYSQISRREDRASTTRWPFSSLGCNKCGCEGFEWFRLPSRFSDTSGLSYLGGKACRLERDELCFLLCLLEFQWRF